MSKNTKLFLLILVIIFIGSLFVMPVFAAHTCEICGQAHNLDKLSAFQRLAYNSSCKVYAGNLLDGDLIKILGVGSGSLFSQALPVIYSCYDALLPVGLILLLVYFVITLLQDVTWKDAESGEYWVFQIIKLVIAVVIMYMGKDIISALLDVAQGIFASINTYASNAQVTIVGDCIYKQLLDMSNLNFWTPLCMVLKNIIPWFFSWILSVAINVACCSKMLELGVRIIFAPVGMSDIYLSGTNGKGFRYLKALLAVAVESSIMLLIMTVYRMVIADAHLFGGTISVFTSIVLSCVAVVAFFKSKEMSNKIFGL